MNASNMLYNMRILDNVKRSAYNEMGIFFPRTIRNNTQKHSYLQIKKSVTNFFITFVVNGDIVFSCTAGSVGLIKKERRLRTAAYESGKLFGKFASEYIYREKTKSAFLSIIAILHAPISFLRLFIMSFKFKYITAARNLEKRERRGYINSLYIDKKIFLEKYKTYRALFNNNIYIDGFHNYDKHIYVNILKRYNDVLYVKSYKS
jgi:hypothetical protein